MPVGAVMPVAVIRLRPFTSMAVVWPAGPFAGVCVPSLTADAMNGWTVIATDDPRSIPVALACATICADPAPIVLAVPFTKVALFAMVSSRGELKSKNLGSVDTMLNVVVLFIRYPVPMSGAFCWTRNVNVGPFDTFPFGRLLMTHRERLTRIAASAGR